MKLKKIVILVAVVLFAMSLSLAAENYILQYRIHKYDKQVTDSVNWFVDNIFKPGDSLYFVTPNKSYNLVYKDDKGPRSTPEFFKTALNKALKADCIKENMAVETVQKDLRGALYNIGGSSINTALQKYQQNKSLLTNRTAFQIRMYRNLAAIAKKSGKKFTGFAVVQQIYQPVPGRSIDNILTQSKQTYSMDLFIAPEYPSKYKKEIKKTAAVLADSGITINTVVYKGKIHNRPNNIKMINGSKALCDSYKMVSKKTSGIYSGKHNIVKFFSDWKEKNK